MSDGRGDEGSGTVVPPRGRAKVFYYVLGSTPPSQSAEWVRRDVQTEAWLWRFVLQRIGFLALAMLNLFIFFHSGPWTLIGLAIGVGIIVILDLTVAASWQRRRVLKYYEKRWERRSGAT